jgi:hypothetical protein
MLEAHLRKGSLDPDVSGDSGQDAADKSVDSARVEYLFKADVPVSGLPHVSPSSSASVILRTEQAARPPPAPVSPVGDAGMMDDSHHSKTSASSPPFASSGGVQVSGSRQRSSVGASDLPRQQLYAEGDEGGSGHVVVLHEEEPTALTLASTRSENWPLVEAVGLVSLLNKGPLVTCLNPIPSSRFLGPAACENKCFRGARIVRLATCMLRGLFAARLLEHLARVHVQLCRLSP